MRHATFRCNLTYVLRRVNDAGNRLSLAVRGRIAVTLGQAVRHRHVTHFNSVRLHEFVGLYQAVNQNTSAHVRPYTATPGPILHGLLQDASATKRDDVLRNERLSNAAVRCNDAHVDVNYARRGLSVTYFIC